MPNFTQGSMRVVLQQPDLTTFQGNGSVVLDSRRTRPLWFDGRFLTASDLEREQNYFLTRQADLGQAGGFGVMHGLLVDQGPVTGQPADAETIVIHAGDGVTPAGELVMLPSDLTIRLSDLAEEENLGLQFGISTMPQQPARTRTGLYIIALRPVEFTANPITSYPTSIQGSRTTHDGDIVEATAVSLVPYSNTLNTSDPSQQQAALARQIFVSGNPGSLSDSLLPLAMVSIQRGAINWIDPYLVRRDSGPQYSGVRFGLTDPATQQAFLLQYNAQLQAVVAMRQSNGLLKANFAATDYFQALPAAGPFPLDAIDTNAFSQVFFPQQMDVRLSIIPSDELPALVEDSMSLPPLDLTLPAGAYSNLAVFALIPVPRNMFASLKSSLPDTPLNPTMPQVLANRSPLQLLKLFQGNVTIAQPPPVANSAWAVAIGQQKYGFYIRQRSDAIFVDFTTVTLSSSLNPSVFGQAVTFTAKVTPASATGTIQFNDGTTALGAPVAISGGSAALTISTLSGGTHAITAAYGGDAVNAPSTSAVLNQTVAVPATVALNSSVNPSTLGQSVTFTATVSPGSATGTIQFNDGTKALGTATLSSGSAVLAVSTLAVGSHAITAVYSGDASDAGSSSPVLTQIVKPITSSTTVASSLNPATFGQGVTFTATVVPNSATGTVQFKDGTTVLGTSALTGGKATLGVSSLTVGAHSITAVYSGDTNDTSSTSAILIQTITQAASGVVVSSAPNPSTVGQAVIFTATVTPNTATGTVQFKDGATNLGAAVALSGGQAALTNATLAVGTHSITAVYSGDTTNAGSTSPILTQTVNQVVSTAGVTSSKNPSTIGDTVSFTATVAPASATGNVQFLDGTTSLGSVALTGGSAVIKVSTLAVGAHAIKAVYAGDTNDTPATSPILTQNVDQVATSVALASSQNPSSVGQSVTFTATVTPASATGTVQFKNGAANLGAAVPLSGGKASVSAPSLTVGSHSITAVYSGDTNNAPSTSPALTQVVNLVTTSVAVTSSVDPSAFGQTVTFTATVTPGAPTGTVQFKDGSANMGAPAPLSGGKASLPASTLSVGVHTITAAYSGDASDAASVSPAFSQTVTPAGSTVVVTSSLNPSTVGQAVTFTATVTPVSATGTIQFKDGTAVLGTSAITGGKATLATSALTVGDHPITAVYSGDANDAASTSAVLTQTVKQQASSVVVASSLNPSTFGQAVLFTAAVTPATAGGTVQFKDGANALGTATIAGGKATFSISTLAVGTHSISAVYSGDANDAASTSAALSQVVRQVSSSVALTSSLNPSTFGQTVTFTAAITPASAGGTIQFKDGANVLGTATISGGKATLAIATLAVGAHSITAVYSGDTNDAASTSGVLVQTVHQAATSVAVASSLNPSTFGQSVTFTATVAPASATGTVQIKDGATVLGTPAISGGKATLTTSTLAVGTHSITAVYSGDANDAPDTSPALTQTVDKQTTRVTLASSVNPSFQGQAVTFTATVTPPSATGVVQIKDGATVLGSPTIKSGQAALPVSTLANGSHIMTAAYLGDADNNGSVSAPLTQGVQPNIQ